MRVQAVCQALSSLSLSQFFPCFFLFTHAPVPLAVLGSLSLPWLSVRLSRCFGSGLSFLRIFNSFLSLPLCVFVSLLLSVGVVLPLVCLCSLSSFQGSMVERSLCGSSFICLQYMYKVIILIAPPCNLTVLVYSVHNIHFVSVHPFFLSESTYFPVIVYYIL